MSRNRAPTVSIAGALLATLGLACSSARMSAPEAGDALVAEVDGRTVTHAELDGWIKDKLFEREITSKAPAEQYERRSVALAALVDGLVLEAEAERRGITTDELIEQELASGDPVTDQEVRAFFEMNRGRLQAGATLEDFAPRIREHLEAQRRDRAVATLREAAEVRVVLEPPRTEIAAVGPARGPSDAPVTIVEFSDYQCPYCKRAEPVVAQVLERYPEEVRFVYRHLPLDHIHPRARPAALAAVCAQEQGRFWEYHARIFQDQSALADEDLRRHAQELGLDLAAFDACREKPQVAEQVERDVAEAQAAGVTGTPAFFVNGILLSGSQPLDTFVRLIEQELERAEEEANAS